MQLLPIKQIGSPSRETVRYRLLEDQGQDFYAALHDDNFETFLRFEPSSSKQITIEFDEMLTHDTYQVVFSYSDAYTFTTQVSKDGSEYITVPFYKVSEYDAKKIRFTFVEKREKLPTKIHELQVIRYAPVEWVVSI